MALPFATNAVCFVLGAVLISRVVTSVRTEVRERPSVRAEMAEGIRWLLAHPPMRTLALTIFTFNVTFGAAWSVLVLYATERLGMGPVGFGLLTTAVAIGGIVGVVSYGRLERRFSIGDMMRAGFLIETATHFVLAVNTLPGVALATFVVFGAHEFVWGTNAETVRQRAVPDALLGRVTGVYRVANVGGLVIGTVIGGLLASVYGITAPYWFGFIGSALLVVGPVAPLRRHRARRGGDRRLRGDGRAGAAGPRRRTYERLSRYAVSSGPNARPVRCHSAYRMTSPSSSTVSSAAKSPLAYRYVDSSSRV